MTKVRPNVHELSMANRGLMALRAAVERVLVEHARQGLPVYIWQDGRVVEVPPMNCERNLPACRQRRYKKPH